MSYYLLSIGCFYTRDRLKTSQDKKSLGGISRPDFFYPVFTVSLLFLRRAGCTSAGLDQHR